MFVISNLLSALALIIHYVLTIYLWVVIARAVISWVNPDPYNPIVRFLYQVTEPVLYRIRQVLPFAATGGIDFSPIIVFIIIMFLDSFLVKTLQQIAMRIG